jgi:hypothetical protein
MFLVCNNTPHLLVNSVSFSKSAVPHACMLAYIALTQRLVSVDSNLVEISGLKYFGKLEGDNNRRKGKAWL